MAGPDIKIRSVVEKEITVTENGQKVTKLVYGSPNLSRWVLSLFSRHWGRVRNAETYMISDREMEEFLSSAPIAGRNCAGRSSPSRRDSPDQFNELVLGEENQECFPIN